jgi:hypothetical protein
VHQDIKSWRATRRRRRSREVERAVTGICFQAFPKHIFKNAGHRVERHSNGESCSSLCSRRTHASEEEQPRSQSVDIILRIGQSPICAGLSSANMSNSPLPWLHRHLRVGATRGRVDSGAFSIRSPESTSTSIGSIGLAPSKADTNCRKISSGTKDRNDSEPTAPIDPLESSNWRIC